MSTMKINRIHHVAYRCCDAKETVMCPDAEEEATIQQLDAVKWAMLEDWSKTKHAALLHAKEPEAA
jgi:hypothetical protein